jgi:hypothetical protein
MKAQQCPLPSYAVVGALFEVDIRHDVAKMDELNRLGAVIDSDDSIRLF